jgi:uncharacterized protein
MTDHIDWTSGTRGPKIHEKDVEQGWQFATPIEGIAIPKGTLQKLYLNPPIDVKGDFRNTLANPTPL